MIVVVLGTDPPGGQYSLMSPNGRNKTSHDDKVTGYYAVRNGSSVTLHDHMDFLQRTSKKAQEIQKVDHIFGDYLEEYM
jgi:ferredoxin-NADP reductase